MSKIFKKEIEEELDKLLHWWQTKMIDAKEEGFYGRMDGLNRLYPMAEKGVILNTRILWTFAAAANKFPDKGYQQTAKKAFDYCTNHFWDKVHSGYFWMLDYKGIPAQTKKQIYAQAFAIYALSEYFILTKEELALTQALEFFELIEKYSKDQEHGGYIEAFSRDWKLLEDLRLSDQDANEAKTMNTHLHILEAYTNLYRVCPHEKVGKALKELIHCFLDKFIDPQTHHLHLFFDEEWQLKSEEISFGHDIEASWLLTEAAEVLGDVALLEKVKAAALNIAEVTLQEGIGKDGRIYNGVYQNKTIDKACHWWEPAEAIVGFLNAYQISSEPKYANAAFLLWDFVKKQVIDQEHGEWHWLIMESGQVDRKENKAGAWKAPYHNGRMCLEVIGRMEKLENTLIHPLLGKYKNS
jgi:mannobiose 2-epimerase